MTTDMTTCTLHRHSSAESARACYERRLGKRADRRIKGRSAVLNNVEMVHHVPPRMAVLAGCIQMIVFWEDKNMPY